MENVTFDGHREPPSFSAHGVRNVINWRNGANGICDSIAKRAAAEVAIVGIALLSVIETVVRPIFALLTWITEGQSGAYHHYTGFKKSIFTLLNSPFLMIENVFCSRVHPTSI